MNYQLIFFEDHMVSFLIVLYANNYKYLNNFCIIHLLHKKSASNKFLENKEFFLSLLFLFNNIYDYYIKNHSKDAQIIINFITNMADYIRSEAQKLYPKLFHYIFRKLYLNKILTFNEINNFLNKQKSRDNKFNILTDYNYLIEPSEFDSISSFHNSSKYLNNTHNISKEIKISIIILYDNLEFLEKTIGSLENQLFENFEIILIYDDNNKINFGICKKYNELYPNIKLINNKEEKGLFYSYSIGIIYLKGNYILILETGFTLAKKTVLAGLYNNLINEEIEIEILEFNILLNYNEVIQINSLSLYRWYHFKSEIDLSIIKYNKKYKELDEENEILSHKIIRANIIKNITSRYISIHNNRKIYNYFDGIILFLIDKFNTKFKLIVLLEGLKYVYEKN